MTGLLAWILAKKFAKEYTDEQIMTVAGVKYADYGTTTFNEIETAVAANKNVKVNYGSLLLNHLGRDTSGSIITHYFSTTANTQEGVMLYVASIDNSTGWSIESEQILTTDDVVNNVTSTSANMPLSAKMGKDLQDEVNNLKNIGRFLSIWDASTGAPTSEPVVNPYTYKVGDYYRIGADGTKNPAPNSTYTTGGTNWVIGEQLSIGDVVYISTISGSTATWVKQAAGGGGLVQDVQINGTTIVASGTGIANIPLASTSVLGVIKASNAYGTSVTSAGTLVTVKASDSEVTNKTNSYKPIVPSNLPVAIKEGFGNYDLGTGGANAWSDAYQTNARTVISAQKQLVISADWDTLATL